MKRKYTTTINEKEPDVLLNAAASFMKSLRLRILSTYFLPAHEYILELGGSTNQLAKRTGKSRQHISQLINETKEQA